MRSAVGQIRRTRTEDNEPAFGHIATDRGWSVLIVFGARAMIRRTSGGLR